MTFDAGHFQIEDYSGPWPQYPGFGAEALQKSCAAVAAKAELNDRLFDLTRRFPKDFWVKTLGEHQTTWRNRCQSIAQNTCSRIYTVKDRAIMSYVTVACNVRNVTANDVRKDVEDWAEAGITEADRIEHAQWADVIEACEQASAAGFYWRYNEPSIKGCKKKK